jgi:hypothetical protein
MTSPKRLGLAWPDRNAKNFPDAISVYRYGNYYSDRNDPAGLTHFDVCRIDPQIRPVPFDRARQKCVDALVDLRTQSRDLALRYSAHPHRLDESIDGARRDALDVRLLHHRDEGLLRRTTRFQEAREVTAPAKLRDLQIDGACPRLPKSLAIAVATICSVGRASSVLGAAALFDFEFHEPLDDVPQELADDIVLAPW